MCHWLQICTACCSPTSSTTINRDPSGVLASEREECLAALNAFLKLNLGCSASLVFGSNKQNSIRKAVVHFHYLIKEILGALGVENADGDGMKRLQCSEVVKYTLCSRTKCPTVLEIRNALIEYNTVLSSTSSLAAKEGFKQASLEGLS